MRKQSTTMSAAIALSVVCLLNGVSLLTDGLQLSVKSKLKTWTFSYDGRRYDSEWRPIGHDEHILGDTYVPRTLPTPTNVPIGEIVHDDDKIFTVEGLPLHDDDETGSVTVRPTYSNDDTGLTSGESGIAYWDDSTWVSTSTLIAAPGLESHEFAAAVRELIEERFFESTVPPAYPYPTATDDINSHGEDNDDAEATTSTHIDESEAGDDPSGTSLFMDRASTAEKLEISRKANSLLRRKTAVSNKLLSSLKKSLETSIVNKPIDDDADLLDVDESVTRKFDQLVESVPSWQNAFASRGGALVLRLVNSMQSAFAKLDYLTDSELSDMWRFSDDLIEQSGSKPATLDELIIPDLKTSHVSQITVNIKNFGPLVIFVDGGSAGTLIWSELYDHLVEWQDAKTHRLVEPVVVLSWSNEQSSMQEGWEFVVEIDGYENKIFGLRAPQLPANVVLLGCSAQDKFGIDVLRTRGVASLANWRLDGEVVEVPLVGFTPSHISSLRGRSSRINGASDRSSCVCNINSSQLPRCQQSGIIYEDSKAHRREKSAELNYRRLEETLVTALEKQLSEYSNYEGLPVLSEEFINLFSVFEDDTEKDNYDVYEAVSDYGIKDSHLERMRGIIEDSDWPYVSKEDQMWFLLLVGFWEDFVSKYGGSWLGQGPSGRQQLQSFVRHVVQPSRAMQFLRNVGDTSKPAFASNAITSFEGMRAIIVD